MHEGQSGMTDGLLTQVSVNNVMRVLVVFSQRAAAAQEAISNSADLKRIPACAEDPVSKDVRELFQHKVDTVRQAHVEYSDELQKACLALRDAARSYGFTDDEIAKSMGETVESVDGVASPGSELGRPTYRGPHLIR